MHSPILSFLSLHLNIIQDSFHVTIQIQIPLQLVQKLALHCIFRYEAFLRIVFCNHARPIFFYIRDTEGDVVQVVEIILRKASEVRTGNITRTFDEVSCDKCSSESVVVRVRP